MFLQSYDQKLILDEESAFWTAIVKINCIQSTIKITPTKITPTWEFWP